MRRLQWYKCGAAYLLPVKSGEEWVKSEQKLFTTPNALFIGIYKGKVKSEEFLTLRRNKKYKE